MSQGEGGGRPTKYKAAYVKQAKHLCKLGATLWELAQFFEVDEETLRRWALQHPKFCGALKVGKRPADRRTEVSLYHRANGYTYQSEEIFLVDHVEERHNPDDPPHPIIVRTKVPLRVPVVKHVPPDTTAAIFWLKNRDPKRWRDIKAVELSTLPGRPVALTYTPTGSQLLEDYHAKLAQSAAVVASVPAGTHPRAPDDLGPDGQEWEGPERDPDAGPR